MRKLHELYEVLYNEIKEIGRIYSLCDEISDLYHYKLISAIELHTLLRHFKSQKPTHELHKEFYNHYSFLGGPMWWYVKEEATEQRKLFIQKLINITKAEDI